MNYIGLVIRLFILCLLFSQPVQFPEKTLMPAKEYELIYPTFLGNYERNFYGLGIPDTLILLWKNYIGGAETRVGGKFYQWSGTGWPGQPTLIKEDNHTFLVVGGLDHRLRKIDAETGETVWYYRFDDAIKGTATIFLYQDSCGERPIILQGSRRGLGKFLYSKVVPSFRAIDIQGKELWRLNIERTESYSRDVDASALVVDSMIFLPAENGILYVIDPSLNRIEKREGIVQPRIIKKIRLYNNSDVIRHRGNLVVESSPVLLGDRLFIAAGSGHIYGIDIERLEIVWDFYVGSDLDGTISLTQDSCLIVPVEKQYISQGGILKLDPAKEPDSAVVWFFPTLNNQFAFWEGGVVGSVGLNDSLLVFRAIDGYLYLLNHYLLRPDTSARLNRKRYPVPRLLSKTYLGPSISTPIIIQKYIITAGYDNRIMVFRILNSEQGVQLRLIDKFLFGGSIESTPLVWKGRIYIGCRDGYLYCLGSPDKKTKEP